MTRRTKSDWSQRAADLAGSGMFAASLGRSPARRFLSNPGGPKILYSSRAPACEGMITDSAGSTACALVT